MARQSPTSSLGLCGRRHWLCVMMCFVVVMISAGDDDAPTRHWDYDPMDECTLFLAESSIPNAGWGMYTGKQLGRGDVIGPTDVVIQVADQEANMQLWKDTGHAELPLWKMHDYYWNSDITYANNEGDDISSIVPGLGMAANSHTGLVNVENIGAQRRQSEGNNGAFSHFTEQTFRTYEPLLAGHELFAEYGDNWFSERFGDDFPLSRDYVLADNIVSSFFNKVAGRVSEESSALAEIWNTVVESVPLFSKRLASALPKTLGQVLDRRGRRRRSAYLSVPNVIRPLSWLREEGMCMDHIVTNTSNIKHAGLGAFATRFLPKGTIVAPAPVVPLSKNHLKVVVPYNSHHRKRIRKGQYDHEPIWEGYQLLLNYVYGHPSTSLVFFPYATAVNLINHNGTKPNVMLQWSSKETPVFDQTPSDLLKNPKTFLMEIVALRDIRESEEIFLDYGEPWQKAWDEHGHFEPDPDFSSAWSYAQEEIYRTEEGIDRGYPDHVEVFCWYDYDADESVESIMEMGGHQEIRQWKPHDTSNIFEAQRCRLRSHVTSKEGEIRYSVRILEVEDGDPNIVIVENVPRSSITFRDTKYSSPQFQRKAFRHEIRLPDSMIPDIWKDAEDEANKCALYVAESLLANAGLGLFSGTDIQASEIISSQEIAIQVEDANKNHILDSWFYGYDRRKETFPLLDNYFWSSLVTKSSHEGEEIQSVIPGIGMLANSRRDLVNVNLRSPRKESLLSRGSDPGAGAMSEYYNTRFVASKEITIGAEIFVSYGENWSETLEETHGLIPLQPLQQHFMVADSRLKRFWDFIDGDPESDLSHDLWDLMTNHPWKESTEEQRVRLALPERLKEVPVFVENGCAKSSLSDRVRSIEWLEEHGRCVDTIYSAMSNIPQAGRGAFSQRRIPRDSVVTTVPLIHLDRRYTRIFSREKNPQTDVVRPKYVGEQLIRNYVYGHPDSSVLLFPASPVVNYINHDSDNANVELRWSNMSTHQLSWLDMLPEDLMKQGRSGLVMEFVALRDIAPNEEILMDYGPLWEEAWEIHMSNFVSPVDAEDYIPSSQFNDFYDWIDPQFELPENIFVGCYVNPKRMIKIEEQNDIPEFIWRDSPNIYVMERYIYRCQVTKRIQRLPYSELRKNTIMPQDVDYEAKVFFNDDNPTEFCLVKGIPRRAIEYFDQNYTSNQFLRSTFRHEIGLKDNLVPDAWRDLKREESTHDEF